MQDSQSAQTPDQTNNQRKQFHIQFNKIISPIMLEGGERSQRGKEKDGCDPVDGSNKLCMAWISWVFLHKLPLWHENRPKCLNPRSTKQVPIWLRKIFGPTIFWGGEWSQRGERKRWLWSSVDGSNKLSSYNLIVGRGLSTAQEWRWQKMMPKFTSILVSASDDINND